MDLVSFENEGWVRGEGGKNRALSKVASGVGVKTLLEVVIDFWLQFELFLHHSIGLPATARGLIGSAAVLEKMNHPPPVLASFASRRKESASHEIERELTVPKESYLYMNKRVCKFYTPLR